MGIINVLQQDAWEMAESKGLHEIDTANIDRYVMLARMALIHTEVSEATQEIKRHWGVGGLPPDAIDRTAAELADTVIRVMDLAECIGIPLEAAVIEKMEKNWQRPHKFGTPEEGIVG